MKTSTSAFAIIFAMLSLCCTSLSYAVTDKNGNENNKYQKKIIIVNNPTQQEFSFVKFEKVKNEGNGNMSMQNNKHMKPIFFVFSLGNYTNCKLELKKNGNVSNAMCDNNKNITGINVNWSEQTMDLDEDSSNTTYNNKNKKYKILTIDFPKDFTTNQTQ